MESILSIFNIFSKLFSKQTAKKAKKLFLGALAIKGKRTVCNALRAMGLLDANFSKYHHVLNRAKYESLKASRILLNFIISLFGLDELLIIMTKL